MAQAPATPKLRRLTMRLAARWGLHLSGPRAPSEAAALAARRDTPLASPSTPDLHVIIPLVGRHHVGDWGHVTDRLRATLQSFQAQSDPNWRITLCGQDRPELPQDARIHWLPFADPFEGNDKWAKLAKLTAHMTTHGPTQGYVMPFDADDLLAPWVVAHIRQTRAPGGYLVTRGFVLDAQTGALAEARPQSLREPGQKAFWKLCGSAAAFRFDRKRESDGPLLTTATQHEHRMFPYLAALAGRPLTPLPKPAALYIVNHGENFGVRRGRTNFKTRFVTRFPATPAQMAEAKMQFALPLAQT